MPTSNSPDALHWWQRGVTYQIYPRSFKDTNGDGVGDLQGVIDQLDYLSGLGIGAIWLSPFYPSPMADFGYDVADYCDVHPLFGDLDTFDRLVAGAHARDIRVIIDYVPNHTSDQHPWFLEARSSRTSPKRDWYIWKDPAPGGGPPNNWGAVFGGSGWEWDPVTGQYYFHHFLKEQPDLNWRNPEVVQAMLDVLRFWLERGVDGFRMDVVGMILKDPTFPDNPPNPEASPLLHPDDLFARQINVYNQDLDEVHDILRQFRQLLDTYGDRCAIGEIWYELPRWIKYYGEHGEGLHLPFNFRLLHLPWNAAAVRQSVDEMEAAIPDFAWPNYVLGNHDVPRLASRVGTQAARTAAMLILTLRGTPTLYYGDELGLENGIITLEYLQDPQGIRLGLERSRDVARTPMQWDASAYAGFSEATAKAPWLPLSPDWQARNVAVMSQDEHSILTLYRRLLDLRRRTPALHGGSYQSLDSGCEDCYVYVRQAGEERCLVALNFSDHDQTLALKDLQGAAQVLLSTFLDRAGDVNLGELHLRPNEGLVILLN